MNQQTFAIFWVCIRIRVHVWVRVELVKVCATCTFAKYCEKYQKAMKCFIIAQWDISLVNGWSFRNRKIYSNFRPIKKIFSSYIWLTLLRIYFSLGNKFILLGCIRESGFFIIKFALKVSFLNSIRGWFSPYRKKFSLNIGFVIYGMIFGPRYHKIRKTSTDLILVLW